MATVVSRNTTHKCSAAQSAVSGRMAASTAASAISPLNRRMGVSLAMFSEAQTEFCCSRTACAGARSRLSRSPRLPSSSGPGRRPLTAKTGVRVPQGAPPLATKLLRCGRRWICRRRAEVHGRSRAVSKLHCRLLLIRDGSAVHDVCQCPEIVAISLVEHPLRCACCDCLSFARAFRSAAVTRCNAGTQQLSRRGGMAALSLRTMSPSLRTTFPNQSTR